MKKILVFSLPIVGLSATSYLFYRHLKLSREQVDAFTNVCSIVFGTSCDATLQSTNAYFLGLPWAGWGVLYFLVIFLLLGLQHFLQKDFEKEATTANLLWIGIGGLTSIILSVVLFTPNIPFCPLCLVIHTLNLILFGVFIKTYPNSTKDFFTQIKKGISYLLTGQSAQPRLAKFKLLSFGFILFLTLAGYQRILIEQKITPLYFSNGTPTKDLFAKFFEQEVIDLPITTADATLGNVDAPIQLLVFSDFECPFCASFAEETKNWAKDYPDKVRVIFKHYPLSNACNPLMEDDMHPNACRAAVASQAAHQQGYFWEFHDKLFQNNLGEVDYLQWATEMNLDINRFAADFQSDAMAQKVQADVELANSLKVSGTPTVFINGRRLEDLQPQNITLLINELLKGE